jgi:hypothetical protein
MRNATESGLRGVVARLAAAGRSLIAVRKTLERPFVPPGGFCGGGAASSGDRRPRSRESVAVLALVLLLPTVADAGELLGRDVIERMLTMRATGNEDAMSVLRLEVLAGDGSQVTRTVATYRKECGDESKNLVVFREPADVAGAAVLSSSSPTEGDDVWMYLPELGRVRQVNPNARSETFMGTDFTYEDLGMVSVDAREHRLTAGGTLDGEAVYKVLSTPRGADTYGKVVTWVSRRTFLPVQIDYFDAMGALLRIARFADVRTIKGIPTPFAIDVENVQTKHRTLLTLLEADYYRGLDCSLFTERHLARAP